MSDLATTENKPASKKLALKEYLTSDVQFSMAIAQALPKHVTKERFMRTAITAMSSNPKLAECTQNSFLTCLLKLAALGIEADGRRAHLIPYFNSKEKLTECQLIIDYKGLVELIQRSGMVSAIHADVVHEGDIFEYSKGVLIKHVPHFLRRDADKPETEGKVFAVYALATMKTGQEQCEVLSRADVERIRQSSRGKDSMPWRDHWSEMAKKTAFRRLSKWLPLSPEFRDALEVEDDALETSVIPRPVFATQAPNFLAAPVPEEHEADTIQAEEGEPTNE